MLHSPDWRLWIASLEDRYGDYGRIALVIVRFSRQETTKAIFDTFLMSCRAMGREVETAVLAGIEETLEQEGITLLEGQFVPTPKNVPAADFWEQMGYRREGEQWVLSAPFPKRRTYLCQNS